MNFIPFSIILALNSDIIPEPEKYILQSENDYEICQTKTYAVRSHVESKKIELIEIENKLVVARGGKAGNERIGKSSQRVQMGRKK